MPAVGVAGWAAWLGGPGTGLDTLIDAGLLLVAGTSWRTRRLEHQADRYAASDGRLDALDPDSLLELFVGEASVPRWRATHPRWTTRFPVGSDRLPDSLRQLQAGVDVAYADLIAATGRRWRTPVVDLVRRLPYARTATGRWPRTVVVARDALTLPPAQLQPRLRAAIIAAHRVPRARAAVAVFFGWVGLLTTFAYALGGTSKNRHPRRPLLHRARLHSGPRTMTTPNRPTPRQPLPDQHVTQRQRTPSASTSSLPI